MGLGSATPADSEALGALTPAHPTKTMTNRVNKPCKSSNLWVFIALPPFAIKRQASNVMPDLTFHAFTFYVFTFYDTKIPLPAETRGLFIVLRS
jgi:hypothetical protein